MKLTKVVECVEGIFVSDDVDPELEVYQGFSADLMSDALRFGHDGVLLLTGLTNPQAIRTAEMAGMRAVLFVRAKLPPPETVALAQKAGIVLMATRYTLYEASGLLYQAGLHGLGPCGDF